MRRPTVILSDNIGTVSHRTIRAAVKKVRAQRQWNETKPARKITRKMTASGRGAISFKTPAGSKGGSPSSSRKR